MCTVVAACSVPDGWPRRQSREQDKTQKSRFVARQAGVRKYFVVTFSALDAQTGDPTDVTSPDASFVHLLPPSSGPCALASLIVHLGGRRTG